MFPDYPFVVTMVLCTELPLQITNVLVEFTVVLISVSCFIIDIFALLSSQKYSIFSLKELTYEKILPVEASVAST